MSATRSRRRIPTSRVSAPGETNRARVASRGRKFPEICRFSRTPVPSEWCARLADSRMGRLAVAGRADGQTPGPARPEVGTPSERRLYRFCKVGVGGLPARVGRAQPRVVLRREHSSRAADPTDPGKGAVSAMYVLRPRDDISPGWCPDVPAVRRNRAWRRRLGRRAAPPTAAADGGVVLALTCSAFGGRPSQHHDRHRPGAGSVGGGGIA